jgi:spore photoproduct lyase
MRKFFAPEKIYVEKGAEEYPYTRDLLGRLATIPREIVPDKRALLEEIRRAADPIGAGKRYLYLARDRGRAFKPFPTPEGTVSCDFYSLHLVEGCDLECSYCILQAYLTNPLLTVYVNAEEILAGLEAFLKSRLNERFRIGTGQLADSLSLDHLTAHTEILVPFFARQSNALLELKTKSANVARLEKLDPRGKTVVSWSVNTKRIQREEEHKCASIDERLEAARQCVSWGYRVGFHFDPLIDYEGAAAEYEAAVEGLFSRFRRDEIAWVSLGSLRFMPELKSIMEKRFPKSPLPSAEWVRGLDGKFRYLKERRIELYRAMVRTIARLSPQTPIYLCMETEEVWHRALGREADAETVSACLDRSGFAV